MSKTKSAKQTQSFVSKVNINDIQLVRVRTLEQNFHVSEEFLKLPTPPKLNPTVDIAHKSFINKESQLINHKMMFKFKSQHDDQATEPLCTFDLILDFVFKIDGLDKYIVSQDLPVKVLFDLEATLVSIALSTSRGIVMERTLSTPFRGILIPVINVSKYLQPAQSEPISHNI